MDSELVRWGEKALQVQDACNGTAVANSLFQLMQYLRDSGQARSTGDINQHPLVQLFVAKLADLARLDYKYPAEAHMFARNIADTPYRKEHNRGEFEVRPV